MTAKIKALEDFEVALLLEAIEHRWGYDFRDYARSSIKRRVHNAMIRHDIEHVSELIPRVLHDAEFFQDVVRDFSITVTEMFRDPQVWCSLREQVFPVLRTYPYFKIWHAACATGEEVYSMAILLEEAGLLNRATIYATDFNDNALEKARAGIYSIKNMQAANRNYLKAGGQHSLNQHYHAQEDVVLIRKNLRERIVWANHNLSIDGVFGEMTLILCRNVLIYFTQPLQNRALELFTSSLSQGGILCLGNKESLAFSSVNRCYQTVVDMDRIYRRVGGDDVLPQNLKAKSLPVKNVSLQGVIAMGCSLGGLSALHQLLPLFPKDFPLPIVITQHIAVSANSAMAAVLQRDCALIVKEACSGESVRAGVIYLAPADYHLLLNEDGTLALSSDEREQYARPSINVMFESVADAYPEQSIGLLLTGANSDGAQGLSAMQAAGAYCIVQDPQDAESPIMPQAALAIMQPDAVLALDQMGKVITARAKLIALAHFKVNNLGHIP
jgi:chemotaxis protein methyltransferase CheR